MKSVFALVDCNNFYASCERVFNPKLKNKPVVVLSNNDGCVIARSNEAKTLGIKMGEPIFQCMDKVKKNDIQIFSTNFTLYGDMSRRVMSVLSDYCSDIEIYSIDEAFLRFDYSEKSNLTNYMKEMRRAVKQWTGIPVSIGIGPTKTLAKAANKIAKRMPNNGGVFNILECEDSNSSLSALDVEDVWGIGRRYAKFLKKNKINTALDFKNCDESWVRKHMRITGLCTLLELRGKQCITLEQDDTPKKSIMTSRSFPKDIYDSAQIKRSLASYVAIAAEKLRRQKMKAAIVYVFLMTNRFRKGSVKYFNSSIAQLLSPSSYTPELIAHANRCFDKIYIDRLPYKKIGVMLSGFVPEGQKQLDFFGAATNPKHDKAMKALDKINKMMGSNTVRFASQGQYIRRQIKESQRSGRFTTRWGEVLTVKV